MPFDAKKGIDFHFHADGATALRYTQVSTYGGCTGLGRDRRATGLLTGQRHTEGSWFDSRPRTCFAESVYLCCPQSLQLTHLTTSESNPKSSATQVAQVSDSLLCNQSTGLFYL